MDAKRARESACYAIALSQDAAAAQQDPAERIRARQWSDAAAPHKPRRPGEAHADGTAFVEDRWAICLVERMRRGRAVREREYRSSRDARDVYVLALVVYRSPRLR